MASGKHPSSLDQDCRTEVDHNEDHQGDAVEPEGNAGLEDALEPALLVERFEGDNSVDGNQQIQ